MGVSMDTAVKERPILFSGPMVNAILAGRKTQTRRVAKPPRGASLINVETDPCPYGVLGDRLWVKESYRLERKWDDYSPGEVLADIPPAVWYEADERHTPIADSPWGKLRPSIHMPRKISRRTLEVVGVRIERVQEASPIDLVAEGCASKADGAFWATDPATGKRLHKDYRGYWQERWTAINGADSWDDNDWVWVVEFKVIRGEA